MRPVVIVIVLPLPQLLVEEVNVVGDAVFVRQAGSPRTKPGLPNSHIDFEMKRITPKSLADVVNQAA